MKRLAIIVAASIGLVVAYRRWNQWQRRWGATNDEIERGMPGDDLIANPYYVTNRAITVSAPPECVYPWLVQMGHGRGGLYSYDFLDRLFGILDRPSTKEIHPEWQDLKVGEMIEVKKGPPFPVAALVPNEAFVLADPAVGWTWQTCMYPQADGTTRLVTRNRANWQGTGARIGMVAMDIASFIMVRRWLQVLKQRAETLAAARTVEEAEAVDERLAQETVPAI
jgi:hypothetical protein